MKMNKGVKYFGAALVLYSLVFGLLVPLKPGVLTVSPFNIKTGKENKIEVTGYNTHFKSSSQLEVYLKLDDRQFLKASEINKIGDTKLEASFNIPRFLNSKEELIDVVLIVNSDLDGAIVKPSAVSIKQDSINVSEAQKLVNYIEVPKLSKHNSFSFPYRLILEETIRNVYYHVPLWFAMLVLFAYSVWGSWKYLKTRENKYDHIAVSSTTVGIILGILGLLTGAIWAKHTWGQYWSGDIKQNMTAISLLIYLAYFVLRSSLDDDLKRNTLSAVYNIFAFTALIPLIFVIPRLTDSLHPGNGGNPAIGGEDLDNSMRMVFYPACIGWIIVSLWIADVYRRILNLEKRNLEI
ncbi:MAG TPA: cytochrome c biogenesis protein CcsA [Saprospiraceae bacterium]|nr:cytochrome c biogenesis protein CcsA [Saprospiraceae bacterium]